MSKKQSFIIGSQGHASVVFDALRAAGKDIDGFVDPLSDNTSRLDKEVIQDESLFMLRKPSETLLFLGIGSVDRNSLKLRQSICEKYLRAGFTFETLVHPSAIVSSTALLGKGCQVFAGAIIQPGAVVGENVLVNTGTLVEHDVQIGSYSHLGPRSALLGYAAVGQRCHVGASTTVLQKVRIGNDSLIGAGSLVLRSVEDFFKGHGVIKS